MKVIELDFISTYFPDKIHHFSECTSTSDELRAWLNNEGEPVIFLADHQTDGRGRKNKIWQSQPKENLLVTIPIFFPKPLPSFITLILGLALKEALGFFLVQNASIKWPNDILIGGKKVAGILAESLPQSREEVCCVLAGVGVNINNTSFSSELSKKATSLFLTTGATFQPLDLLKVFLKNLEKKLLKLELDGFYEFKALWEESSSSLGRLIAYPIEKKREAQLPKNEWTGRARILGIDYDGALLIQKEEGGVEKLFSEEVEYLDAFYD